MSKLCLARNLCYIVLMTDAEKLKEIGKLLHDMSNDLTIAEAWVRKVARVLSEQDPELGQPYIGKAHERIKIICSAMAEIKKHTVK